MSEENYERIEHAVGERFRYGDITLEVKESDICNECKGCYFEDRFCGHVEGCVPRHRRDMKTVIFVEVKDIKKKE